MIGIALVLLLAAADPSDTLRQAEDAFDSSQFEQAIPLYRSVLPALQAAQSRKARLHLAQALFFIAQQGAAKNEIRLLLKQAPTIKVDTSNAAPDFVAFFEGVRDEQPHEVKAPVRRPRPAEPKITITTPVAPASIPQQVTPPPLVQRIETPPPPAPAPWYLKILPFGVGQFANHDIAGGVTFLTIETVLLASNLAFSIYNGQQMRGTAFPHSSVYPAFYWLQLGTGVALYGSLLLALIDAFVWSPDRGASRSVSVSIAPTPGGMALSGFTRW